MTDDEINEQVAIRLGWKKDDDGIYWHTPWETKSEDEKFPEDTYNIRSTRRGCPDYCCDIRAAWEVVEKCIPGIVDIGGDSSGFQVRIKTRDGAEARANERTAPMAICKAFLEISKRKKI